MLCGVAVCRVLAVVSHRFLWRVIVGGTWLCPHERRRCCSSGVDGGMGVSKLGIRMRVRAFMLVLHVCVGTNHKSNRIVPISVLSIRQAITDKCPVRVQERRRAGDRERERERESRRGHDMR